MNYPPSPTMARDEGFRRLSRLTWRATQLSAIATVAFASLFARTAGAHTSTAAKPPLKSPTHTTPATTTAGKKSATPAPKVTHRPRHKHHAAVAPAAAPSSAAPAPAAPPPPPPTLAPPPAPPTPAPAPAPTKSSGSTGGG